MDENQILVPIKQPRQVWKHLRMIHCLQYDGQQANNADADKNLHIFAHCLNNEIWVETNEGQRTEGFRPRVMMKQTPCLAAH